MIVRCRACHQRTDLHAACTVHRTVRYGATFERRRYSPAATQRCGGCNTLPAGYHHVGCELEDCPLCGLSPAVCHCERPAPRAGSPLLDPPHELVYGKE